MIFAMRIFTIIFVKGQEKRRIKVFKLIQGRNEYHGKIHVDIVILKCMLQKSAVDGMFLKLINQHNFPLQFHLETFSSKNFFHFLNNLKIFHPISTKLRYTKTGINHKLTQIFIFIEFLQQIG